ncbi:MAG: hypothetical protein KF681_17145 [Bdellovibrionaceae bacterium]|nr:hypothetical protein [Pseudobdellovibrionaceae bacterium]
MKKLVLVLATLGLAAPAMASKARLQSLQGASFLKDTQTIFVNPAHVSHLGQYLTFEMGSSSATAATRAEGGFVRKDGDVSYGAYLGHQNETQSLYRASKIATTNGGTYLRSQNPVEVFYAKGNWGASVGFSNSDQKSKGLKEQSLYGRFGVDNGDTEFFGTLEVLGQAKDESTAGAEKTLTTSPVVSIGAEKDFGRYYGAIEARYAQIKAEPTPDKSGNDTSIGVSIVDRSLKNDKRMIYYGAGLNYTKLSNGDKAVSGTALPVFIGIEGDITSWAIVRGSVSQNLLLGETKDEFATAPADSSDTLSNNTVVALGIGLKYSDFVLDGSIAGSTSGDLNGNNVLSKGALTYYF